MSDPHLIDKGGTSTLPDQQSEGEQNIQQTLTYAKALEGETGSLDSSLRNYLDIIAQHRKERNVIEIKLKKVKPTDENNSDEIYVRNLSFDEMSELVFEVLKISFDDCIGADFYTGRYDTQRNL